MTEYFQRFVCSWVFSILGPYRAIKLHAFSDRQFVDARIIQNQIMLRSDSYFFGSAISTCLCFLSACLYRHLRFDFLDECFITASKRIWNIEHFVLPRLVEFSAHPKQNSNSVAWQDLLWWRQKRLGQKSVKNASYQAANTVTVAVAI